MAGYEAPVRSVLMEFVDGDLKGLEVEARLNVPFNTLFRLVEFQQRAPSSEGLGVEEEMLRYFAEHCLLGWNLTLDGQPVPCTPQTFLDTFSPQDAGAMLGRYISAVGSVPAPLARRSGAGKRSATRRTRKPRPS